MDEMMERMEAALAALQAATERMGTREAEISAEADERVERIVATVEGQRETELAQRLEEAETKLAEAEARLAELSAAAALAPAGGRKTAAAGVLVTLVKQGIAASALDGLQEGRMEAGALDAALSSLSIEQRFAVKAEMLRSGLLG